MSHKGRCFRSYRRTRARKEAQGCEQRYVHPIRWKVPQAIAPFLVGIKGQCRATFDQFAQAIARYAKHQALTGKGAPVRAAGAGGEPRSVQ